jgi:4-hydroxy-tetrahydrodipicolinate reductase
MEPFIFKIGIAGFCGRMGQRVFALAKKEKIEWVDITFGLECKGHPQVGKVIDGVKVTDDPEEIKNCWCLIDFSTPSATLEHLNYLVKFEKNAVIGTTGFDEEQQDKIKEAARTIPIVFSPNMSVGVNLLFKLVQTSARILKDYKVYIEETHHIHKKDAPSGTAKKIAEIINRGGGFEIKAEDIKSIREDEVVGDHRVIFESELDRIELYHSAKSRDIFAKGALLAAYWIGNKKPGLYSMDDVLNLKI